MQYFTNRKWATPTGQGATPEIRPATFGAATLEFKEVEGKPIIYNIQGIGGEVLGEQTVPRADACAATLLLSRVHANAVARLGIDASYDTHGISKRNRKDNLPP